MSQFGLLMVDNPRNIPISRVIICENASDHCFKESKVPIPQHISLSLNCKVDHSVYLVNALSEILLMSMQSISTILNRFLSLRFCSTNELRCSK